MYWQLRHVVPGMEEVLVKVLKLQLYYCMLKLCRLYVIIGMFILTAPPIPAHQQCAMDLLAVTSTRLVWTLAATLRWKCVMKPWAALVIS